MNDRFKKQDLVANTDKEKFDLACNLLTEQLLQENPDLPIEQALHSALITVGNVMDDTIKYRGRMRRVWDFCTAIHYN